MPRRTSAAITIGIDPGKNTLHLIGLDARGSIVLREKVARHRVVGRLANVPPCLIGIEAGAGTHYVTREPRSSRVPLSRRSAMAQHSRGAAILLLGLAWCLSKCLLAIERSWGVSPSVAIGTCACCSCKRPALYSSDQEAGSSTALDLGWQQRLNGCTTMCWLRLSPTNSPASHGACSHKIAYTKRAYRALEGLKMSSLRFIKGMMITIPLRHRRSPGQASERRWLRRDAFS
jgi:hypothetical protein